MLCVKILSTCSNRKFAGKGCLIVFVLLYYYVRKLQRETSSPFKLNLSHFTTRLGFESTRWSHYGRFGMWQAGGKMFWPGVGKKVEEGDSPSRRLAGYYCWEGRPTATTAAHDASRRRDATWSISIPRVLVLGAGPPRSFGKCRPCRVKYFKNFFLLTVLKACGWSKCSWPVSATETRVLQSFDVNRMRMDCRMKTGRRL